MVNNYLESDMYMENRTFLPVNSLDEMEKTQ
jgi:hypothetical protein